MEELMGTILRLYASRVGRFIQFYRIQCQYW